MAISTYKTFLMHKASTTYAKLVDIKDFPDLGGAPEAIETTTLSDGAQTYIAGITSQEALVFNANYTATDYATLKALEGSEADYAVWFGATVSAGVATPTGSDGKFEFKGYLTVTITGGGVNEAVGMSISIMPSTAITQPAS